jgi:hypothetical protein
MITFHTVLLEININCRVVIFQFEYSAFQGSYNVQGLSFDVDASALPSGDYKLRGSITVNGKEDACVEIVVTIA